VTASTDQSADTRFPEETSNVRLQLDTFLNQGSAAWAVALQ